MYWLIGVCAAWGLLISIPALYSLNGHFFEGLVELAVAWGPGGLLAWFLTARSNTRQALRDSALREAGIAQGQGFEHTEEGTGIALNPSARTLALWGGGVAKRYGYAEVREWVAQYECAGEIVAFGGLAAGMGAAGANSRARRAARANTGLFVTVRDVERPKWRVAMRDKTVQARWMEILRQEINEGGVSAGGTQGVAA